MVWCGARKGRQVISFEPPLSRPATEWILVVSRASARVNGGIMVGMRLAIIDLPAPGGPTRRMLWPPAQATSKARLTVSCPLTSAKSTSKTDDVRANSPRVSTTVGATDMRPDRKSMTCWRLAMPQTSRLLTTAASVALASGTIIPLKPSSRALMAIGRAPEMGRMVPSRLSSPMMSQPARGAAGILPSPARRAMAIGRSKAAPSLRTSAGARLMTVRLRRTSKPAWAVAVDTR